MSEPHETMGMGWLPDYPDFRDYTPEHEKVQPLLRRIGLAAPAGKGLPPSVDLRRWCPPIENQLSLNSCTANAAVALLEYFEQRAFGKHIDASRLFLYKVTRNLLHVTGDTGAFLRSAMGALVLFGAPPEEYWPYKVADYEEEPPSFCYAFAQNYHAVQYICLDPPGMSETDLLRRIKPFVAAGFPSMFGFTVYSSIAQSASTGDIPFPATGEKQRGGHAMVVVGYDDKKVIQNTNPGGQRTTGAFLVRNSWGTSWGDQGYGHMPYEYVLRGLALDWWTLIRSEWVDTGQFAADASEAGGSATRKARPTARKRAKRSR